MRIVGVKERSDVGEIGEGEGAVTKDAAEDETRLCLSKPGDFKLGSVAFRIETIGSPRASSDKNQCDTRGRRAALQWVATRGKQKKMCVKGRLILTDSRPPSLSSSSSSCKR